MSQAEQLAELLNAVKDVYHSRLLSGVAITLAVYDWLISFAGVAMDSAESPILLYPYYHTPWNPAMYIPAIRSERTPYKIRE
ncbi:hypothetical protein M408DRAFT_21603 [Serendipita vermifera MAFF 305830]|uniref:Uncharacterized protein n=1 Tax=Serendipita vermifera MAFF 305830 TaxID=933852 RepID=A0A0C3BH13_SERVB|nr:hypothetical protein M408DRAFT_21603 [Serendipita vermifera MAFF 305830]